MLYTLFPGLGFFTVALAGALAGFLWWNAYPAKVFMGDTCSLALGAALAGVAIIGKQEFALYTRPAADATRCGRINSA